jgi:hypothetical protein
MIPSYVHRPRARGEAPRPPAIHTMPVTKPYRAEHWKKKIKGKWQEVIEDAIDDARKLGIGARVVSKNGVLLLRFDNALKFMPKDEKPTGSSGSGNSTRRADRGDDDAAE